MKSGLGVWQILISTIRIWFREEVERTEFLQPRGFDSMAIFHRKFGAVERWKGSSIIRHIDTSTQRSTIQSGARCLRVSLTDVSPADFVPLEPSSRPFILSPGDHLNANTRFNLSSVSISCSIRGWVRWRYLLITVGNWKRAADRDHRAGDHDKTWNIQGRWDEEDDSFR